MIVANFTEYYMKYSMYLVKYIVLCVLIVVSLKTFS
jgi:hypothetical protein